MAQFIVLEGIDGAGTTTQSELLLQRFMREAQPAIKTREPTDGPIGVMIRQMLAMRIALPASTPGGPHRPMTRETLALLFAADRLDHAAATIDPALEQGIHVISDRYMHSSLAYQGDVEPVEGGQEEHVDYTWIQALNSRARVADITFLLELDVETSLQRIETRGAARDIYETREKLERLVRRYDEVMGLVEARGDRVVRLDARDSIESLHAKIWEEING